MNFPSRKRMAISQLTLERSKGGSPSSAMPHCGTVVARIASSGDGGGGDPMVVAS